MKLSSPQMLRMLGDGGTIDSVCKAAGISRSEFDEWWKAETAARLPATRGRLSAPVGGRVEIARDARGIPHILARNDEDLFFGFGFAMAQDRLWQLDYLRRRAFGRLSEVLGPDGLESDLVARTVGLNRIAQAQTDGLPAETAALLAAFAGGIDSAIDGCRGRLPIEFDLLGYEPEPWRPVDSMAIWVEFQWYLTGRFPVIVIPELVKRALGPGQLYDAFLLPEAGDEVIVPSGHYAAAPQGSEAARAPIGGPDDGRGSNNWLVDGRKTASGKPLVASDPHIAFGAVSCWYEAHIQGGSFNVAGVAYAGFPAIMIGRSERVAWGVTNGICSQRDLYQERTDPEQPGRFLYDGRWEKARQVVETIHVRGQRSVTKTVLFSRNGPIVDEILPSQARDTGPVSLRWLGATRCDELTPLLLAHRARSCRDFREALRGWRMPNWNLVFADVEGHTGYQSVGRIPIRTVPERGYRPGWDPQHQWQGVIPFDAMPALSDPEQGWIRSANNRVAPDDFPYPLSGTWANGHRAQRVREMLQSQGRYSPDTFKRMQYDVTCLRARDAVPEILNAVTRTTNETARRAAAYLDVWNRRMEADSGAAAVFEVFFRKWQRFVTLRRLDADTASLATSAAGGLALALLSENVSGWFADEAERVAGIVAVFEEAVEELCARLGPDVSAWRWGDLHRLTQRHRLSHRGELSRLLDRGNEKVGGNGFTVCNTGPDDDYRVASGANYRFIGDLGASPAALMAIDSAGQSGHPGSAHYCDQLDDWVHGVYHEIPLDRQEALDASETLLKLEPDS